MIRCTYQSGYAEVEWLFCSATVRRRSSSAIMRCCLKNIFLYTPIKVKDRYLSVNEVTFDTDKSALITYFELEFIQETNTKSASVPKMKNLDERVVTDSHGTSENIN